MDTMVICAVLQDAATSILEWIGFHRLIGVDRFVLYDLGSTDGTAAVVARSRFGRQVTVVDWPRNAAHEAAYDFAANHAGRFVWAAFIEHDEFLHPLGTDSIRGLLPRYDGFSAVLLRRLRFDATGRKTRPGGLIIGSCTNRFLDDRPLDPAVPTLLRTSDLQSMRDTPLGFTLTGEICNARGEPVPAQALTDHACEDVLVVNRYSAWPAIAPLATAGPEDGEQAAPGTDAVAASAPRVLDAPATVPDRRITRFIPRLRAMLHDVSLATEPRAVEARAAQPRPAPAANATPQPLLLGIGIITYNRQSALSATLDRVQQHTRHPRTVVAVADDGSTDGTLDMLRERQVQTVTGSNRGIAWNKNRALFLLFELLRCDVVVLLEDDAYPVRDGWEAEWMTAAIRWGHANVAGDWLRQYFVSGTGTVDDPILSQRITAQCAVFSREALLFAGYFDSRFRGYGHEHVEHTARLIRLGYGGAPSLDEGQAWPLFKLLWGGLGFHSMPPSFDVREAQAEQNRLLAQQLFRDYSHRAAWRNETEAKLLRDEMRASFPRQML